MIKKIKKCNDCKKDADYICKSGRCVPCERKVIGQDGLDMLKVLLDLTNEGKYNIPQDIAINEFLSRRNNV